MRTVCKWHRRNNGLTLNPRQILCLASDAQSFYESVTKSQILNYKSHWRNVGKHSAEQNLSTVIERGWESTRRLVEDIWSIWCNSITCSHLRRLHLSWTLLVWEFLIMFKSQVGMIKVGTILSILNINAIKLSNCDQFNVTTFCS